MFLAELGDAVHLGAEEYLEIRLRLVTGDVYCEEHARQPGQDLLLHSFTQPLPLPPHLQNCVQETNALEVRKMD